MLQLCCDTTQFCYIAKTDEKYRAIQERINAIYEQYPRVMKVFDREQVSTLTEQECAAAIEIASLRNQRTEMELDAYCEFLEEVPVSKQAFSKARANLNPAFVRKFADGIAEVHAQDSDAPNWNGMSLIAIDGTDIALENSAELKRVYGCSGSKRVAATALGSLAYGSLDHAIYDCRIVPYATDERDLAKLHMERLHQLGLEGSLLLFDRWYPSASFLAYILDAGFSFVMRVRGKWNLQVDAVEAEDWVILNHENKVFLSVYGKMRPLLPMTKTKI